MVLQCICMHLKERFAVMEFWIQRKLIVVEIQGELGVGILKNINEIGSGMICLFV